MFKRIGSFFKKIWLICSTFCVNIAKLIAYYCGEFFKRASTHYFWLIMMFVIFILGVILLIIPISYFLDYFYIILGLTVVVLGFIKIAKSRIGGIINYYYGTLFIILGVILMYYHQFIVMIFVGLFFIFMPIYRIIKSSNKKLAIHQELLMLIIGVLTIFSGDIFAGASMKILAIILIGLAGYLGYLLWMMDSSLDKRKEVIIEGYQVIDMVLNEDSHIDEQVNDLNIDAKDIYENKEKTCSEISDVSETNRDNEVNLYEEA